MPDRSADVRADEREEAERSEAPKIEIEAPKPKTAKEREAERQRLLQEAEEEQRRKNEEKKRQKELEQRRRKRKLITPAVVLAVGAVASITMFICKFETTRSLKILLAVLVISWIVGSLIQFMFELFAKQNEEEVSDEGEVINKGLINNDDTDGEVNG